MKPPPLEYRRAATTGAALALLAEHGDDARLLAGGQSLVPLLAMRLAAPAMLIDIGRLDELDTVAVRDGVAGIGALVRHRRVADDPAIARAAPLLASAAPLVAHPGIRNRGTIGGALALGDPAAEFPACALALDAEFRLASAGGERTVAADAFFAGPMETALRPDEMLIRVDVPSAGPKDRFAIREIARRRGDYALAGVAARARLAGDRLTGVRLAFFGVGDRPILARRAASIIEASAPGPDVLRAAREALVEDIAFAGGVQASADLRRYLAGVVLCRALADLGAGGPAHAVERAA